jgi:glycoprotein-N-acetylgalactosamine 3-beta-galactosyltransferase
VSFHYVSPNQMYVLDYLIYHLKPYGINYKVDMPNVNGDDGVSTKSEATPSKIEQHPKIDNADKLITHKVNSSS